MISAFITNTLPCFIKRVCAAARQSFTFSVISRAYQWLYKKVHQSLICSIFTRHENEGNIYNSSLLAKGFDKAFSWVVGIIKKIFSLLTFGSNDSLVLSLGSKFCRRFKFLDFEFIIGAVFTVMFLCPGQMWYNVYALAFSLFLLGTLLVLMAIGRRETLKLKSIGLPFIIFVIASIVGVGIARNLAEALRVFVFFFSAFLFCIIMIGAITDTKKLKKILGFIHFALFVTAIVGFVQRAMGVEVSSSLTDLTVNAGMPGRVYSTFENPNNYAEYIVLMFPLAFAFCTMVENKYLKLLTFAMLIFPVGALLMTYSRSGWVSFALAVTVFLFFYNKKLLPLLFVFGVLAIPLLPQTIYNRILTIGSTRDSSNMYRIYIWEAVLKVIKDNWLVGLGLGPGNFRPDYLTYAVRRASPAPHSHMLYLELWVELGLMGILGYLTYYITTIRNAVIRIKNSSSAIRMTLIAGVSALAGIAFVCTAEYIWFYPRVMFSFFIVAGILAAATNMAKKETKE